MLYPANGHLPAVEGTAYAAPGARIVGDVTLCDGASVWYNAVLRADNAPICIGADSNIQDGCILHTDPEQPCTVGEGVTVGHGAILHACTVGDHCTIGMGAILLNGAVIGENSIVGAGALVTKGTIVPPGSLVFGSPAKCKRPLTEQEMEHNLQSCRAYRLAASQQLSPIHPD